MSIFAKPALASVGAKVIQLLTKATDVAGGPGSQAAMHRRFAEIPRNTRELTVPTSIAPARVVVYRPTTGGDTAMPVHVNFHGGGYVMAQTELDDPLCRYLAAESGVVVINVDYVVAPQHRFPAAPHQAFEVVQWVARHGGDHGWDGSRLTVGGQSAGGALAAAVARQALEQGGPDIALQVLHYPPLDLSTSAGDKRSVIAKPLLKPWMGDMFDNAYVPDPRDRADRLVSPANPADTADLTGIAPAVVLTAQHDILREEGARYAERLRLVGALVEHHDIAGADHGYDSFDLTKAREVYAVIARHLRQATVR